MGVVAFPMWVIVVGGLVLLAAVGALIFWWISRGPDDDPSA